MKYAPQKVFIIEGNDYIELTYQEYCSRCEKDLSYRKKCFLPLHGMLMEVSEEDYKAFYKAQRRQKYLMEQSAHNQDISMDMLSTKDFQDRALLTDHGEDIAEMVAEKILLDKLRIALHLLEEEERELIELHFFQEIPQTELGKKYGVNQSNISRRINRILLKIKKLMEI